jgi:hypothetical protein
MVAGDVKVEGQSGGVIAVSVCSFDETERYGKRQIHSSTIASSFSMLLIEQCNHTFYHV